MAALKENKRQGKKKGGGGGNHSQKYSKGSITFEKLLLGSTRALVVSTRESKQTTVHCSNLRLPAASAHLHSPLRDPSPSQKQRNWGKQKKKESIAKARRWEGEVPPSLRTEISPWKGIGLLDQSFIAASRQPASHPTHPLLLLSRSIAVWHYGPGQMPPALNHSDAAFTDPPAISLSAALRNSIATDIWLLPRQSKKTRKANIRRHAFLSVHIFIYPEYIGQRV